MQPETIHWWAWGPRSFGLPPGGRHAPKRRPPPSRRRHAEGAAAGRAAASIPSRLPSVPLAPSTARRTTRIFCRLPTPPPVRFDGPPAPLLRRAAARTRPTAVAAAKAAAAAAGGARWGGSIPPLRCGRMEAARMEGGGRPGASWPAGPPPPPWLPRQRAKGASPVARADAAVTAVPVPPRVWWRGARPPPPSGGGITPHALWRMHWFRMGAWARAPPLRRPRL